MPLSSCRQLVQNQSVPVVILVVASHGVTCRATQASRLMPCAASIDPGTAQKRGSSPTAIGPDPMRTGERASSRLSSATGPRRQPHRQESVLASHQRTGPNTVVATPTGEATTVAAGLDGCSAALAVAAKPPSNTPVNAPTMRVHRTSAWGPEVPATFC
jgi:hypothetical protein